MVGLNHLDTHVEHRGGEPAFIYIQGDLTNPARVAALRGRVDEIRGLDIPSLARDSDGISVDGGIFGVIDAASTSEPMVDLVAQLTGVTLTDDNHDQIPDTQDQLEALLAVASQTGVPFDETRPILTPDNVNTSVNVSRSPSSTVLKLGLVNSRAQESVALSKEDLQPTIDAISADLDSSFVQVTGSPFIREGSLADTSGALGVSLPVALILCLLIGSGFLRSVRYGLAGIVPILMVVTWLYAFMQLAGYSINIVTATIAAVSIGIGIDFGIQFIMRFREEFTRSGSKHTAIMILLALVATLAILPSLLVVITVDSPAVSPAARAGQLQSSGGRSPKSRSNGSGPGSSLPG